MAELNAKVDELRAKRIVICPPPTPTNCNLLDMQIQNQEAKIAAAKADAQTDPKIARTLEAELLLMQDQRRQMEALNSSRDWVIAWRELEAEQQILNVLKVRYQQEVADVHLKIKDVPVQPRLDLILIISGVVGLVPLSAGVILLVVAARKNLRHVR